MNQCHPNLASSKLQCRNFFPRHPKYFAISRYCLCLFFFSIVALPIEVAFASPPTSAPDLDVFAKELSKFGLSFTQQAIDSLEPTGQSNGQDDGNVSVSTVLSNYGSDRKSLLPPGVEPNNEQQFLLSSLSPTGSTSVPETPVPELIVRDASQAVTNDFYSKEDQLLQTSADDLVYLNRTKLSALNITASSLQNHTDAQIATILKQVPDFGSLYSHDINVSMSQAALLNGIADLASGQTPSSDIPTDTVLENAMTTAETTMSGLAQKELTFIADKSSQLQNLESKISDYESAVSAVNALVQGETPIDQTLIDYLSFGDLSPQQSLSTLQTPEISGIFSCPIGTDSCPQASLKDDLQTEYTDGISLGNDENSDTTSDFDQSDALPGLTDIMNLSKSLGLDSPQMDSIENVASGAVNIIGDIFSGNIMGGLTSVFGIFGSGPSEEDIHYQNVMQSLKSGFDSIDNNLAIIQKEQSQIFESLNILEQQNEQNFDVLNAKLDYVQNQVNNIDTIVSHLEYQPLKPCYSISETVARQGGLTDRDGRAVDLTKLLGFAVAQIYPETFDSCITTIGGSYANIVDSDDFGSFVSLDLVDNISNDVGDYRYQGSQGSNSAADKQGLFDFYNDVQNPAYQLINASAKKSGVSEPALVSQTIFPPPAFSDEGPRPDMVPGDVNPCSASYPLGKTIYDILCPDGIVTLEHSVAGKKGSYEEAETLLSNAYSARAALEIANSFSLIATLTGGFDQSANRFIMPDQIVPKLEAGDNFDPAEPAILDALLTVDVAIGSYSMQSGDLTARATLEQLELSASQSLPTSGCDTSNLQKCAVLLFESNGYLSANVATLYLREAYLNTLPLPKKYGATDVLPFAAYEAAVLAAASTTGDPFLLLHGLFGNGVNFQINPNTGQIEVEVFPAVGNEQALFAPIPSPYIFSKGYLQWPQDFYSLLDEREALTDRLLDYDSVADLSDQNDIDLVRFLQK